MPDARTEKSEAVGTAIIRVNTCSSYGQTLDKITFGVFEVAIRLFGYGIIKSKGSSDGEMSGPSLYVVWNFLLFLVLAVYVDLSHLYGITYEISARLHGRANVAITM